MSKKNQYQQNQQLKVQATNSSNNPQTTQIPQPNPPATLNQRTITAMVQPEEMSLKAHQHIQKYLEDNHRQLLDKHDLNAILRLSQHLRVFGLLSAAGYINQSNAQENNEVRKRTVPVWECLLGLLIDETTPPNARKLMETIQNMARDKPTEYMNTWRKSLILCQYWNFWGRAYSDQDNK